MLEPQVWSLGGEDPLEKGMATHSSILAWRIQVGYSPRSHKELDTAEATEHSDESWASKEPSNTTCLIYSEGSPRVPAQSLLTLIFRNHPNEWALSLPGSWQIRKEKILKGDNMITASRDHWQRDMRGDEKLFFLSWKIKRSRVCVHFMKADSFRRLNSQEVM